jgi:folylpolyglutamate synthase/dihydropteroate synthase
VGDADVAALAARAAALDDVPIPTDSLLGPAYQKWNATLAMAAMRHVCPQLDETQVLRTFRNAQLPGRLWRVEPYVYADIAHNVEKLDALADELQEKFGDVGKILVIGASKQRLTLDLFPRIAPLARTIIVTGASFKGQSPEQVQREIQSLVPDTPTLVIAEPRQAFQVAKSMRVNDEIIFLTGSTYMIEQVLNPDPYARYLNATFGWRTAGKSEAQGTVNLTLPSSSFQLR